MRVWFKNGVSLRNLQPQTVWAMERVLEVYRTHGHNCVFTSIWRPSGPKFSLHTYGYAFDTDTDKNLTPKQWDDIEFEVKAILGDEYDILAHDAGSGWHLHVEFDPPWLEKEDLSALQT